MTSESPTVAPSDPLIAPLSDNRFLIELLAEIVGAPQSEVQRLFIREHHDMGASVREELAKRDIAPYVWSEKLDEFYAETNALLYEALVWNRSPLKNDMRRWVGSYLQGNSQGGRPERPLNVLTFGDGLGIDACYLAKLGHDVSYFEVSRKCRQFAERLFAHANLNLDMIDDPAEVGEDAYDVVVCLDVLEHVPNPVSVVGWLAERLRTGGKLLVHAPFWCIGPKVQTHLKSNRRFCGRIKPLYEINGLFAIDGRLLWNPLVLEKRCTASRLQTRRLPWRIAVGAALLWIGRYWSFPYVTVGNLLADPDALKAMIKDLAAD